MKKSIFLLISFLIFSSLYAGIVEERYIYGRKYYKNRFEELFKAVSKYYSREELEKIVEKALERDEITEKSIHFIYSPLTLKKQAGSHEDRLKKMINDETVKKGVDFFGKYKPLFCELYAETKVEPSDIISIINWESKLGAITGEQKIIKVFAEQYFLGEEMDHTLFILAEYRKTEEGAMSRPAGEKRVERLTKNAFSNFKALLIQAKEKNFDPLEVKGSWAGAIGFPQFMPASMQYAKDGNGDGKIDLFVMEDAIASVANYLKMHGYLTKGRVAAFKAYNNDKVYAEGVKTYSDSIKSAGADAASCGNGASAASQAN